MSILIVVNDPREWPFEIPDVQVVDARSYLTKTEYSEMRSAKVDQPLPFVSLSDHRLLRLVVGRSARAQAAAQRQHDSGHQIAGHDAAGLGRAGRTDSEVAGADPVRQVHAEHLLWPQLWPSGTIGLSLQLFNMFQSPLLRAQFGRDKDQRWQLRSVSTISASGIPPSHHDFVADVAAKHFAGRRYRVRRKQADAVRPGHPAQRRRTRAAVGRKGAWRSS